MPPSSPASFGSQCPSCGKYFASDSNVLRHMNQQNSSCASWFKFLESIHLEPPTHPATRHPTSRDSTSNGGDHEMTNIYERADDPLITTTTCCETAHTNTPSVLGSGPGFMEQFDRDPNAEKRNGNLYYPFLSKEEWSLASWLSCSGLSMRAIDDFLALPIVSLWIYAIPTLLIGS